MPYLLACALALLAPPAPELAPAPHLASESLLEAARAGDLARVRGLLDAGVEVNAKSEYGATALHFAASKGHAEVVRLLVARRADLNAVETFYSTTPLVWAQTNKHPAVVGELLAAGATGGDALLKSAAASGDAAVVRAVIEKGWPTAAALSDALAVARKPEVAAILTGAGAKARPKPKADPALAEYAGTYKPAAKDERGFDLSVGLAEGGAALTLFGDELEPAGGGAFRAPEPSGAVVTFRRDAGKVVGLDFASPDSAFERAVPEAGGKPAAGLAEFAGVYKGAAGERTLRVAGAGLSVERDGAEVFAMTQDKGDLFRAETPAGRTVLFRRNAAGVVVGYTVRNPVTSYTRAPAGAETAKAKPAEKLPESPDPTGAVTSPANWPQFRGPGASGAIDGQFPPTNFDLPANKNVRWKTPIDGLGHSCPVVWGDRLFVTTAVGDPKAKLRPGQYGDVDSVKEDTPHEWRLICLDKNSGKVVWDQLVCTGVPKIKRHLKGTHANPTVATDGKVLVVSFGAEGLYGYDFAGKQLWKRDLGKLDSGWFFDPDYQWGFASSPVVHKGAVYVQCDAGKNSGLLALKLSDGSDLWRAARDEPPTWGTPTVVEGPSGDEVVCNGTKFARSYDALSGKERWRVGRLSEIAVPTPVAHAGLIYVCSGYSPVQPIFAVRAGAEGDLSPKPGKPNPPGLAWSAKNGGPYLPTPVAYNGHLYVLANSGLLSCYDAATGKKLYSERVGGTGYTAAPVAADGRIYCAGETSGVRVVKAGPSYELLAVNPLGETCMATPAISDGVLFVRTERHVVAFGLPGK